MRKFGIKSIAEDGHLCDSKAEKSIDDLLFQRGIPHSREPSYSFSYYRADWKIEFCDKRIFVEYFGLAHSPHHPEYRARMEEKRRLAQLLGIVLVEVYPGDLQHGRLTTKLQEIKQHLDDNPPLSVREWLEDFIHELQRPEVVKVTLWAASGLGGQPLYCVVARRPRARMEALHQEEALQSLRAHLTKAIQADKKRVCQAWKGRLLWQAKSLTPRFREAEAALEGLVVKLEVLNAIEAPRIRWGSPPSWVRWLWWRLSARRRLWPTRE